jgi:hypothetical protein
MSPVAKRRGGGHTGRAVAVAITGVVVALGTAFFVATLASRGDVTVRLGDDRFSAGRAENLARIIDADDQPVLFPDPARFTRAIYLDHVGADPDTGWLAIGAFVPEQPECTLTYDPDAGEFVIDDAQPDSCDRSTTFPRSGAGLRTFPTEVDAGRLYVDLQDRTARD